MAFLKLLLIISVFYLNSFITTAILVENNDRVPRIMVWQGWVNNRIDETTGWVFQTDPDGRSGAGLDKLQYCRKFYPLTAEVRYYKNETSKNWYSAGNTRNPQYTYCEDTCRIPSYECVQPPLNNPRIMYLTGKVNQHASYTTGWKWVSNPDRVSGANIQPLKYCRKLFPATIFVYEYIREYSSSWVNIGGDGVVSAGGSVSMLCVQRENQHFCRGLTIYGYCKLI